MYEQGVIRPPTEASSLLVRVTRNCPWNQCLFCPAYKGTTFSRRSVAEVKGDIDEMAHDYEHYVDRITSAFLQDANSLIMPTSALLAILDHLKKRFPKITRVTTYARAKTMTKKSVREYEELREAGLTRIHTGMESGSPAVLEMMRKGSRPEDMRIGAARVMGGGISLSEYIMPGLGGRTLSNEHALETARLLNDIRPDYIRVRTFAMHPQSPLKRMVEQGDFVPMTDEEIVREIRLLIVNLDEMHSFLCCGDFSLNLLMQVNGFLDEEKAAMLKELDKFLSLNSEQKNAYSLLRRSYPGVQQSIDAVKDMTVVRQLSREIERLEGSCENGFYKYIEQLMAYQVPEPQTDNWT
jgi:radical SAM superfamily enzyme